MRIVAYSTEIIDSKILLSESTGDSIYTTSLEDIGAFLLESYSGSYWQPQFDRCIRVCWNLNATVAPIIRLIGRDRATKLHETKKAHCPPFKLFYVPDKLFAITHIPSGDRVTLYGLDQYFPGYEEPVLLEHVKAFGEKLMGELKKMNLEPDKLTSPIAIYEQCILKYLDLPQVNDMPVDAAEMAYRCAGKLWIEAHQIGYFDPAYDYDLTSAFPSAAKELVDIRHCQWIRTDQYQETAVYGYALCDITIKPEIKVSPILEKMPDGFLFSPVGQWTSYLTKAEIDFINWYEIGETKIKDAWWAIPLTTPMPKPLEIPLADLLKYKDRTELQSILAKRMSVGVYGKFGEEWDESFGPYFNPCWFAEISTNIRLKVGTFIYENHLEDCVLHISVDGVLSDQPAHGFNKNVKPRSKDGSWKLDAVAPALVVSSGLLYHQDKKPKGLTINKVLDMIDEHPQSSYYTEKIRRRVTLGDALATDRFETLGRDVLMPTSFDFHTLHHDRCFPNLPKTGEQLANNIYMSRPYQITNEEIF